MKLYVLQETQEFGYDHILGTFDTLLGAETYLNNNGAENCSDEIDEYDPPNIVKAYWLNGHYVRILEHELNVGIDLS